MSDVTGTDASVDDSVEAAVEAEPTEEVAPDPHALDAAHEELVARFETELGEAVLDRANVFGMPVVRLRRVDWRAAAEVAKGALECDFLSFVSGIDWMPAPKEGGDDASGDTSSPVQPTETTYGAAGSEGRFQVFARVQSTSRHWGITFKADVDDESMLVQSWVPVYAGRRLARARVLGDVRLRVRRPPGAAPPLPPVGVRGAPAAQGLPAAVARGEAVARSGRRRADARRRRRRLRFGEAAPAAEEGASA